MTMRTFFAAMMESLCVVMEYNVLMWGYRSRGNIRKKINRFELSYECHSRETS